MLLSALWVKAQGTGTVIRHGTTLPTSCNAFTSYEFYLTSVSPPGFYTSYATTNVCNWIISGATGPTGATGATGAPGTLSSNSGITVGGNGIIKGPDPHADVIAFGAHGYSFTALKTTATMGSGSTAVTVASGTNFINGDGVTIIGAGASTGLSTPSAPTVTPSIAAGETGLGGGTSQGMVVNSLTGASTYKYRLIGRTKFGGHTAVSSATTISNGQATLGLQTCTIATASLSNGTITITTATPCNVSVGARVHIYGTTSADFSGTYTLATVNTGTQESFTITNTALDSRGLGWQMSDLVTLAGATGGTMAFYFSNHLTWTPVANTWEYYVCAERLAESNYHLIGVTKPSSSVIGWVDAQYDDYGSPFNDSQTYPPYIETGSDTPNSNDAICNSGTALPDPLTTTIVSGAPTTSWVLANASSNAVSGQTAIYDDAPNILAAANSISPASGSPAGTLFLPPLVGAYYQINSYLKFPIDISVKQLGTIEANETIELPGSITWSGFDAVRGVAQFGFSGSSTVTGIANPMFYFSGGSVNFTYEALANSKIDTSGAVNGGTLIVCDCRPLIMSYVALDGGTDANTDYLSMDLVIRSSTTGGTEIAGNHLELTGGPDQVVDKTWTPGVYIPPFQNGSGGLLGQQNINFKCDDCNYSRRGITAYPGGGVYEFNWGHRQGGLTPFLELGCPSGCGNTVAFVKINNLLLDTETAGTVATLGNSSSVIIETTQLQDGASEAPGFTVHPPYTGERPAYVIQDSSGTGKTPNTVGCTDGQTFNTAVGFFVNSVPLRTCFEPEAFIGPNARMFFPLSAPGTVTAVLAAGGSLASSTYQFAVAAFDADGQLTITSALSNAITTNSGAGNSKINLSWPALPGAVSYRIYSCQVSSPCPSIRDAQEGLITTNSASISAVGSDTFPNNVTMAGITGCSSARCYSPIFESPEGSAPSGVTNFDVLYADSTAHRWKAINNNGTAVTITNTIASGTSAMGTGSISATSCAAAVTTSATGTLTTDTIQWSFSAAPSTGYTSGVHILPYTTTDNVNFLVCNPTAGSLSPAAATLNWKVIR